MSIWQPVGRLMREAVSGGVFPGGVVLVSVGGRMVFCEPYGVTDIFSQRPVTGDTVFDLASLTKPLATTLAVMRLIVNGKLRLDQQLGALLPRFENSQTSRITVRHLLGHNSGLADYRRFFEQMDKVPAQLRRDALRDLLAEEPLVHPVGSRVLYSDLGFMALCWIVETVSGRRLDGFVRDEIYGPLGLENLFFVDLNAERRRADFAATERCPWRRALVQGVVHDENCWSVGGVDGHAGLFGTAGDVHRLLSVLRNEFYGRAEKVLFGQTLLREFFKRHEDIDRALGFDSPSAEESSCGQYFSRQSVGHLGFTGTSFWMDLEHDLTVILLTNRVHPSRENTRIKAFRPGLHDAAAKAAERECLPDQEARRRQPGRCGSR